MRMVSGGAKAGLQVIFVPVGLQLNEGARRPSLNSLYLASR
jgi:hypothetical protein